MDPKPLLWLVLMLQLAANVFALSEYFYEFGNKQSGYSIYTKEGTIPLFSFNNYYDIPVPVGMEITYVSVTVGAINPPKVDYDNQSRTVSIKYSFLEVTWSNYKIFAKGTPIEKEKSTTKPA